MLFPWLAVLALTGAPQTGETTRAQDRSAETAQTAPEVKPAPNVDDVVRTGIALLLQNQERYRTDRGIGRLPDDQLEAWQAKEQERL
jgi:hypothetical protein